MVLICNNNILTIDTFHKNRCREKTEIRDINIERKYAKEEFKEEPVVPPEMSIAVMESNKDNVVPPVNSIIHKGK